MQEKVAEALRDFRRTAIAALKPGVSPNAGRIIVFCTLVNFLTVLLTCGIVDAASGSGKSAAFTASQVGLGLLIISGLIYVTTAAGTIERHNRMTTVALGVLACSVATVAGSAVAYAIF